MKDAIYKRNLTKTWCNNNTKNNYTETKEYIEEKEKYCILRIYDNTDDLQYNECYNKGYIDGIKENNIVWHKQSDTDDIFDACNDLSIHCFVCKMKDGSYNIAFGKCVEDNNGMFEPSIYFEYKDSEYYLEDIDIWCEIPKF